jgi:MYXO-CTERM domain-containing protein
MSDLMCESGDACEPVRLCVVERACGGLRPPDAGPCFIDHAVGVCGGDGTCSEGSCLIRDACVVPGSSSGGCSCSIASRGPSGLWLLTTLSLFGLVLGRRMRYLARR